MSINEAEIKKQIKALYEAVELICPQDRSRLIILLTALAHNFKFLGGTYEEFIRWTIESSKNMKGEWHILP